MSEKTRNIFTLFNELYKYWHTYCYLYVYLQTDVQHRNGYFNRHHTNKQQFMTCSFTELTAEMEVF